MDGMKFFRKTDIIAIAVIIAAAAVIWLVYSQTASGRPVKAEITIIPSLWRLLDWREDRKESFRCPRTKMWSCI
jgi:hypothetical protein